MTTNIQKDGTRISLHNLGKGLSETTRKEIEKEFGLKKAGEATQKLHPHHLTKEPALYGKVETKKTITTIVNDVMDKYAFSSLADFNAILKSYGQGAWRGEPSSRMFQKQGLVYGLLNAEGERGGVPIKASAIYGKPTLACLEKKFESGRRTKLKSRAMFAAKLTTIMKQDLNSEHSLKTRLEQSNIQIILHRNTNNFVYGITYIDHDNRLVYKGSELGKEFNAATVREKWN